MRHSVTTHTVLTTAVSNNVSAGASQCNCAGSATSEINEPRLNQSIASNAAPTAHHQLVSPLVNYSLVAACSPPTLHLHQPPAAQLSRPSHSISRTRVPTCDLFHFYLLKYFINIIVA